MSATPPATAVGDQYPHTRQAPGASVFPGRPYPLGATVLDGGTNFSVVADGRPGADASGVELCLVDASGAERRWEMRDLTQGCWHAFVPGVGPGQRYGYRVAGHDPGKLLLDPYARRVDTTEYDLLKAADPGSDTLGAAPLGVVVAPARSRTQRPEVPWEHTVIYEAHVKGLTATHPAVPPQLRGRFGGVAHPAVIDHLTALNVTTLELLPVTAYASEPGLVGTGRRNYWGYSPLSYFAMHPGYASRPGAELDEFVAMVDALHTAGIELILDMVYNHTCEGGPAAPITLSWRGFAPDAYYLSPQRDLTGCGNTIDTGTLPTIRMITDSLRYLAGDLGVDGFRFDLASVLGRPHGEAFTAASALLTAIAADPLLARRKLIAEPWDATGDGYALGRFGPDWAEWNDQFRDSVRDFWRGSGTVADLAFRLTGSQDRFGNGRRPWASINFVTAHDGFTLRDVVSYAGKHNDANGEHGQDGTNDNRSANYGAEGETDDQGIRAVRLRQARNIAATLLLSTGTPMICMGDELWRTQQGNNNPYCQDSELTWLDWQAGRPDPESAAMSAFFRRTLDIRAHAVALHQGEFFLGQPSPAAAADGEPAEPDLVWFNENGSVMAESDWHQQGRSTLLMWVNGSGVSGHGPHGEVMVDDSWLLILHAGQQDTEVQLPNGDYGVAYIPTLDTATPDGAPADPQPLAAGMTVTVPGRSTWLLRAVRH